MRFYDPQNGHIAIDGQNIKDITIQSLRQKIAVVSQEQGVFNDTLPPISPLVMMIMILKKCAMPPIWLMLMALSTA